MSGLEVVAAVSAVISAFHGGSELLKHLKKKRRNVRSQAQQEFEERQLQDSLETGEQQIGFRYAQDMRELGDYIRVGDAIARDRLLHIAVIMQAEIIKSLQMAVKHENAILNLKILHEASIMNRKDTFATLDELKQRIIITMPLTRQSSWAPEASIIRSSAASVHTIHSNVYSPLSPTTEDCIPTAVTLPAPRSPKESKSGLARYFQMKRNSSVSSSSIPTSPSTLSQTPNLNFSVALEHMVKAKGAEDRAAIMKDIDEIISSYQSLQVGDEPNSLGIRPPQKLARQDTLAMLNADTAGSQLNRGAVQMHQNLTRAWEEHRTDGALQHSAFDEDVFGVQQHQQPHNFQQHVARIPFPYMYQQPQHPHWSTASASGAMHLETQSLGGNSSTSSQHSHTQTPPLSPHSEQSVPLQLTPSNTPCQQVNESTDIYSPPLTPYASADRACTQPIAPLSPQQTRHSPAGTCVSLQRTDTPIMCLTPLHQSPSHRTREEIENNDVRPRYHLTPSIARNTPNIHNVPDERIIRASTMITAPATTPATTIGLRHDSASAPSRTSTDSAHSISMGILPGRSGLRSSIRSNTIENGPTKNQSMMDGRPCKDNNYWGFCKGAWAVREDVKKGLALRTIPQGMYNSKTIWECQSCNFKGDTFSVPHATKKNKKDVVVDPHIHVSKAGVRYRWVFLAKSHVKRKSTDNSHDESNYGCVFCSAEGNVTGIYGSVETLMNHVWSQHVADMSEKTRTQTRCILGRIARVDEAFDINIPIFSQVQQV